MQVDLRQERERRGLSLEEVSAQSRIPQQYLAALESGQDDEVPAGPFLRSYERQYLAYLGLPDSTRRLRPAAPTASSGPRPLPAGPGPIDGAPDRHAGPSPAGHRNSDLRDSDLRDSDLRDSDVRNSDPRQAEPGGLGSVEITMDDPLQDLDDLRTRTITRQYDNVPVMRLVLAGFLATTALVLILKLLSGVVDSSGSPTAAATAAAAAPPSEAPEQPAEPQADGIPATGELPAGARAQKLAPSTPGLSPAAVPGMELSVRAVERVRVDVELDGVEVYSGWMAPGYHQPFHASDEIAIEVDDLTRLRMAYDGERVEPLGNLSHPRRLVFVRDTD